VLLSYILTPLAAGVQTYRTWKLA